MEHVVKFPGRRGLVRCWLFILFIATAIALLSPAQGLSQFVPNNRSTAGYLLVATPELDHSRFGRTVIVMLEHDSEGAMGFVVNRPLGQAPVAELLGTMGLERAGLRGEVEVFWGGPVEPGRGFVLHSADYEGEGTTLVNRSLGVTTRSEVIRELAAGRGPSESMIIFGYAGWAPGQLENEMASGAWFTIPLDTGLVFDEDQAGKWKKAMDRRGIPL